MPEDVLSCESCGTATGWYNSEPESAESAVSKSNYLAAEVSHPPHGIIGKTLLKRIVNFFKRLRDAQEIGSDLYIKFHKEVEFYKAHKRGVAGYERPLQEAGEIIKEGAITIRKTALGVAEAGESFLKYATDLLTGKKGVVYTEVRTAHHTRILPGLLEINDNLKTWSLDQTGKTCYHLTIQIESFFHETFGKAFEGADCPWLNTENRLVALFGSKMLSTVNYGVNFLNAFWNSRQMVYGDGDGKNMGSFLGSDTVPSHEIGHGITERLSPNGIAYSFDAGGINESLSDITAISFSHWNNGKKTIEDASAQGKWLIGEGLVLKAIGNALRNMADPGTAFKNQPMLGSDPQEGFGLYSAWMNNPDQDPHLTSATGNLWFVKVCENLAAIHPGLHSYDLPLHLVLWSLPKMHTDITYPEWAALTLETVADRFGENSPEWNAVYNAWSQVEVPLAASSVLQPHHTPALMVG